MLQKSSHRNQIPAPPSQDLPLPEFLRSLFWEVDFDRLRVQKHERYIIERTLEYGGDPAIRWLQSVYDTQTISEAIRNSRKISRNTATLWALTLDIPRDQILCLSKRYRITPNIF